MSKKLYGHDNPTSDIMLQAFYWDSMWKDKSGKWYRHLETMVDDIRSAKISLVWLPPPSKSRVTTFVGYTPMDYYDLGEFKQWVQDWDSENHRYVWNQHETEATLYGKKDQLLTLITKLKAAAIRPIADIVINHRAGQQHNEEGERIRWQGDEHAIASGKMAWGDQTSDPEEITTGTGGGHVEDDGGSDFGGNLAHANPKVRAEIIEWMRWLRDVIGFEGWRYDYARGYAPNHIAEYNYGTQPYLSVGEYWPDGADVQPIYDWIDRTDDFHVGQKSLAFDFPLQVHLKEIFWGGRPFAELARWQDSLVSLTGGWPEKSVTFLDNHDTYRKPFSDFPADNKRLVQGYAFLLTHPGIPCIFWNHLFKRSDRHAFLKIGELCRLRVENGITNQSDVEVLVTEEDCYAALIDEHIIVKIGDQFWNPEDVPGNWRLQLSGRGWAIWRERCRRATNYPNGCCDCKCNF